MLNRSKLSILGGRPRRIPKLGQNNCLTYNFLHCEFQLFTSSCSKWPFFRPTFWGEPSFDVGLLKINMQTTPIRLHFHQLSDFCIKRSRRS